VVRYVDPEQFARYEQEGQRMGFHFVASGPLVRSSYHAAEAFVATRARPGSEPTEAQQLERLGDSPGVQSSEPGMPVSYVRQASEPPLQLIPAAGLVRR
jgi:hypothetical protein